MEPIDATTHARIMAVLDEIPDPEIPAVTVTDLGIVREIRGEPPVVLVTPTYTGCPATLAIEASIRLALDQAGFENVGIATVLSPAWSTDWISSRGRDRLEAYGIAPPPKGIGAKHVRGDEPVSCPRCGSFKTIEVSRFGSTPCKALWRCEECLEPFDRFKCH